MQEFLDNLDVNNLDKHCIMSDLEDEEVTPETIVEVQNNKNTGNYRWLSLQKEN